MSSTSNQQRLREVVSGTPADEVKKIIDADGGVIVKGLFAKHVDRLNEELDPVVSGWREGVKGNEWMEEFAGRKTKRVTQLVARSKTFREEMIDDATMLSYIDTMMLETSDSYWMNAAQVIQLQPGEKAQMLHRDLENYPIFRKYGPEAPEVMCNCLVALSDYTEDMGATRVIPGSHKWSDFEDRGDPSQTIPAVMEKGDALVYSGKMLHGGGHNASNRPRRALALAFCPGWLVPEEAYPFVIPLEIARTMSPRAQQLTGFRSFHNAKLGGGSLWQVDYLELADFLELNSPEATTA
ncbi:phytanoyl-CoA dioxygenase family protein [Burkholderia multivorans]|uniref:phytanoyl-CoA dioxygenase family protein n=1 Tax=Burkholderia multivorans TaxID=87883 RepID=UPI0020196DEA|nr:phytanoyl-CoA dioxygenase family protein [Burkholderia multivorans]MCO1374642.1 phytanoyl-CoA dioxygenase family protein [Burkholderia multivorans]MCO1403190.1 phytanoyl-CoA dioxygenase family protein [Burkholderia multivorans]MCO1403201.1 phytanoyl-CoA dioxygenase family protein [Burkholderia multivorans]MCO1459785.1 phytanoyl-CoA dioxygenase family protein [Burkholderia multivorans]UQO21210.1 phytanoyl-CoA dioxygenase family protein [Burkholderia multivorans]